MYFDENGEFAPELVPDWISIASDDGLVVGFVRGDELFSDDPTIGLDTDRIDVYDDDGQEIGSFGPGGFQPD